MESVFLLKDLLIDSTASRCGEQVLDYVLG